MPLTSSGRQDLARRRPDIAEFERSVDALVKLLSVGELVTAAGVAARQGCSKLAAYRRLRAVAARGYKLQTQRVRESGRGPESVGYAIVGRS